MSSISRIFILFPIVAGLSIVNGFATETSGDKPYEIIDGKVSENVMEGWRTYNGGACGGCHGPGGAGGGVAPALAESLKSKIDYATFRDKVTNGVPGTFMKPHKTNKRVMDNLDNLYAYLKARADGVLGKENLIKYPLGFRE